ncbi:MAG: hypothetical protein U9R27_03250 [Campylobacterota bacterium]|nr:hypothetical protein [Campylobacterota bacterium]
MRTILLLTLFFYTSIYAIEERRAIHTCELFNNMKHTKNSGQHRLEEGVSYRIIKEQGEQYYVTVPDITIPNRWVDRSCFDGANRLQVKKSKSKNFIVEKHPKELLLAMSWQNAFCQTHRNRRECRLSGDSRITNKHFVLHGLWPQPRDNLYCSVPHKQKQYDKNRQWNRLPKLELSDEIRKELLNVMPGVMSNLHRHEWIKHGTCYGTDANSYYAEAISLSQQVNRSKLSRFFANNQGRVVTLEQVRFKADESFGRGAGKRVELRCKSGMITELWFHLGYGGDDLSTLLKGGKVVRSRCQRGLIDRAGFR